jgi:hypothetical protein
MLVWALWLANSLLHWLKEWYRSLTTGGAWRSPERIAKDHATKVDKEHRLS